MSAGERETGSDQDRLLAILHRLLALREVELKPALDAAAEAVAEAMGADKVDVFLHEPSNQTLVAAGTIDTPMGLRQKELGLDRLAIANGGSTVAVFLTGRSKLTGHSDRDPEELRGVIEGLGVRSQIGVPLFLDGEPRGVLMVCSAAPECFAERDLRFAEAVAHWVALVGARAAQIEKLAGDVAEQSYRAAAEELIEVLTPRQRDVAALIASGLSNAEIAERLVITPGTTANHVEAILHRLGFKNRSQIAVWAAERGLQPPADGPEAG